MNDQINLTDEEYWRSYWLLRKDVIYNVSHTNTFWDVFYKELRDKNYSNFIEIGGFPGYFSIFAQKYYNLKSTLIDLVVVPEVFNRLCECNKVNSADFEIIQGNIFEYQPENGYDVVFSSGVIEHFNDVNQIIEQHIRICNKGGKIIITLPNFRGLFGLAQWLWDRKILKAHNLNSMKLRVLRNVLNKHTELASYKIFYYGPPLTTIGNYDQLNKFQKKVHKWFTGFSRFFAKWVPLLSLHANSIVIVAEKKQDVF